MTLPLDDPKVAEFVGIMLGDGSIGIYECKNIDRVTIMHQLKITTDSRETIYIEYLSNLMTTVLGAKPAINFKTSENTVDIRIFRKEIVEFVLNKIGLKKSPKWDTAKIPDRYMENGLEIYVLRGLFDTDGCVNLTNNNGITYPRLEIKICPSPMQQQIVNILMKHDFTFKVQNLDKGKIRIRLNGKQSLSKWLNVVGTSNPKHLNKIRKIIAEDGISFKEESLP